MLLWNYSKAARCLLLAMLVSFSASIFCQTRNNDFIDNDYFSNFNPSKPTKSALGSFGNLPVNYFTGEPEINLNLLSLQSRELSIPISLNYDASGVKVDDISGPVGLKWNLNAGGFVVRQLNGLPDEDPARGYWKYQQELNSQNINPTTWTERSETGSADTEPDEFFLYIPGRTIRFFIKDGVPVSVPRQGIRMAYTVANGRINGFFLTTEDGTHYEFGLLPNAIEERRVDNFSMVANFAFDYRRDEYEYSYNGNPTTGLHAWFYVGDQLLIYKAEFTEKINYVYNTKWYLISIKSSGDDKITFNYTNTGTTKYVTQPVVTRKIPLLTKIENYTYEDEICTELDDILFVPYCSHHEDRTIIHTDWLTPAYAAFSTQCPDHNYGCSNQYPQVVLQGQPNHFDPKAHKIDPEGIFLNQSLVTESVIRLDNIATSTGNKVIFYNSSRDDLPGSFKYDRIVLMNMKNEIIENLKLKYSITPANQSKNYMWLSEAFLIAGLPTFADMPYGQDLYASAGLGLDESDVTDPLYRKYVLEGLKEYNYKRLYLDAIVELSPTNAEQHLYSFLYENRASLKRRITPLQTVWGYSRNESSVKEETLPVGRSKAKMLHAYDPATYRDDDSYDSYGSLIQLKYPTGGYTKIAGADMVDYDRDGAVIATRMVEGIATPLGIGPILESYQNSRDPESGYFKRFKILSSMAQNRSFRQPIGFLNTARIYNGTKDAYNGYEVRTFTVVSDAVVPVFSVPLDLDMQGNLLPSLNRSDVFPFTKSEQRDHRSGLPLTQTFYDKNGRVIKSITNTYITNPFGYVPPILKGFVGGSFPYNNDKKIRYGRHSITTDWIVLEKTIEKVFDQSAGYDPSKFILTETSYTYDAQYMHPTVKTVASNGTTVVTKYKCASHSDFSFTDVPPKNCRDDFDPDCIPSEGVYASEAVKAIRALREANRNSTVIEEQTLVTADGITRLTNVNYKTFKFSGDVVTPAAVYTFKGSIDPTIFKTAKVGPDGALLHDIARLRKMHSYDEYDATTKNILKQTTFDGTTIKYVWEPTASNTLLKTQIVNEGSNEQRTTYNHKPLVGPTVIQDPNGISAKFEYDDCGRLKLTRDNDNNIIDRYRYHFVDNNINESLTASIAVGGGLAVGSITTFAVVDEPRQGTATTITFDFGDGTSSTATSPTANKIYASTGTYVVKVTKSNPEYGSSMAQKTITIKPALNVTICAEGPVKGDVCRIVTTADVYGSCTSTANRYWTYVTKVKATATGACSGAISYSWEYKTSSSSTWVKFGTTQEVISPFRPPNAVTGDVRCIVTDGCSVSGTSPIINFNFFKSNSSCTAQ